MFWKDYGHKDDGHGNDLYRRIQFTSLSLGFLEARKPSLHES